MEETLYQRARELGLVRKERQARWEDAGLYLNYLHAERGAGGGNDHNKQLQGMPVYHPQYGSKTKCDSLAWVWVIREAGMRNLKKAAPIIPYNNGTASSISIVTRYCTSTYAQVTLSSAQLLVPLTVSLPAESSQCCYFATLQHQKTGSTGSQRIAQKSHIVVIHRYSAQIRDPYEVSIITIYRLTKSEFRVPDTNTSIKTLLF